MKKAVKNFAFIDSQNLNLGIRNLGWKLDFLKFRIYLKEKFSVDIAYIFIGYVPGNEKIYTFLQKMGYICVFKPVLNLQTGKVKGNIDAELVLHTMIHINNFHKAIIVSGDGDFYCLIEYLMNQNKLAKVLIPNEYKYSALIKTISKGNDNVLSFINRRKNELRYIK